MKMPHLFHRWEIVCDRNRPLRRCRVCGETSPLPRPVESRGSQPLCPPLPYPPPRCDGHSGTAHSDASTPPMPMPRRDEYSAYSPARGPLTPPPWGQNGPAGTVR